MADSKTPDLTLTMATAHDAETLARMATQGFTENFGHLYSPENLAIHLEETCSPDFFVNTLAQGNVIIIATMDNIPVGYTKAGKLGLPVQPDFSGAELHRLYVLSPYQGKRIGDELIQAALDLPMMREADGIYLGVWEDNHRAQRFYKKYGFTEVGEYLYYVGPHADRELIMLRKQAPQ